MIRSLSIAAALVLALAGPAIAQEVPQPVDEPAFTPTPAPGCERGEGTDADYAYCPDPCAYAVPDSDDADYAYCPQPSPAGGPQKRRPVAAGVGVQPLAAGRLPVTGGEPAVLALIGLGLLLAGAGLRRLTPSPGAPRR